MWVAWPLGAPSQGTFPLMAMMMGRRARPQAANSQVQGLSAGCGCGHRYLGGVPLGDGGELRPHHT